MVDVFPLHSSLATTVVLTPSGAHSHSRETHVCYVMVLSNQRALEVIKQVNLTSKYTSQEAHTFWAALLSRRVR